MALALGACGSEKATTRSDPDVAPGTTTASLSPSAPPTSLTVTLRKAAGSPPQSWTLTCDPPGGTHPSAAKACAQLAKSGKAAFAPPPPGQTCTDIYGGPELGTVKGTFQGAAVDASFSRKDGCELARWGTVKELFGELPRVR